jgi:hypothetical protein
VKWQSLSIARNQKNNKTISAGTVSLQGEILIAECWSSNHYITVSDHLPGINELNTGKTDKENSHHLPGVLLMHLG